MYKLIAKKSFGGGVACFCDEINNDILSKLMYLRQCSKGGPSYTIGVELNDSELGVF
jgi:hypothetical protein